MVYDPEKEKVPPPLEVIGGVVVSPGTDIPLGKHMRIGLQDCLIYESAIERGYRAGVAAHLDLLQHQERTEPVVLDDKQFSEVIEHFIPPDLSPFNDAVWRGYFIIGWTCVFLGLASQEDSAS
jgi:hypothetical protein